MNEFLLKKLFYEWSDDRVVEGACLESMYTGNRIEGSNPSHSASLFSGTFWKEYFF